MKNKFLNTSLVFGLGFVFLRGISFLLLPVYTNFLSTYDAGIIFILYALLAFLNPVYALGMDAALFKFFNSSDYSQKQVVSSSLLSVVISSFCLSLFLFFCSSLFITFLNQNILKNKRPCGLGFVYIKPLNLAIQKQDF